MRAVAAKARERRAQLHATLTTFDCFFHSFWRTPSRLIAWKEICKRASWVVREGAAQACEGEPSAGGWAAEGRARVAAVTSASHFLRSSRSSAEYRMLRSPSPGGPGWVASEASTDGTRLPSREDIDAAEGGSSSISARERQGSQQGGAARRWHPE